MQENINIATKGTKYKQEVEAIRDRLVNGLKNWNGGYDGWVEWWYTLYEPDAHYIVYGHRFTLQQHNGHDGPALPTLHNGTWIFR